MSIKKEIIKGLVLLLSSITVLWLTEFMIKSTMKKYKTDTIGKINAVMDHELDSELTIWGASTAYVNFNPKILVDSLNMSSFNMGIDGTNIDQYAGLLYEFLSYTSESKYLIIALDIHGGLTKRDKFYHLHNWLHHIDNKTIADNLSDIDDNLIQKLKSIPFYSLTKYNKHGFPYFRQAVFEYSPDYRFNNYGYRPNGSKSIFQQKKSEPFEVKVDDRTIEKVKKACSIANYKGIQCLIVITPMFHEGLELIQNKDEFRSRLSELTTPQINILDFSDSYISKSSRYFKDNTHLNKNGADELTRLLAKEIKQLTYYSTCLY